MKTKLPTRKGLRLREFDYGKHGAYFITVCTQGRKPILSEITQDNATATEYMPPTRPKQHSSVSSFVSTFKRFCNKEYGCNVWQRSFYDHIIRNQRDYDEVAKYIYENPMRWKSDKLYLQE